MTEQFCKKCQELKFSEPYPVFDKYPQDGLCVFHSKRQDKVDHFLTVLNSLLEKEIYDFRRFIFPDCPLPFAYRTFKDADFRWATFKGEATFLRASFKGEATFFEATFEGKADFFRATFEGRAYFGWATFRGEAVFRRAIFGLKTQANFREATFQGNADFRWVTFEDYASFTEAKFYRSAWFDSAREQTPEGYFKNGAEFANFSFLEPERVRFRDINLSRCRFFGTDLRKVEFTGCTFAQQRDSNFFGDNRAAFYDEFHQDSSKENKHLARMYRQMKQNLEDSRNHLEAGNFHIAEMVMTQRQKKDEGDRAGFTFLWLYWLLSGYGERPVRVSFWILATILVFAIFYIIASIWWPMESTGFWAGILKSLQAMTALSRGLRTNGPMPVQFVSTFQAIIGPALFALLIIALKRRFKR